MKKETLDELKRLDAEATPAPWEWWTSCSFRRLSRVGGPDGGVLHAYNQRSDNHPDIAGREEDKALIAAARNALPRLLAEREKALGETVAAIQECCGSLCCEETPEYLCHSCKRRLATVRFAEEEA